MKNKENLTPQEFWSIAPWNYDMNNVPLATQILVKYNKDNPSYHTVMLTNRVDISAYVAWLPLPEQK